MTKPHTATVKRRRVVQKECASRPPAPGTRHPAPGTRAAAAAAAVAAHVRDTSFTAAAQPAFFDADSSTGLWRGAMTR